jgi:gluconolactonase
MQGEDVDDDSPKNGHRNQSSRRTASASSVPLLTAGVPSGGARSVSQVRTLATGLDHPEGVALGLDGFLYAGGEAGQVYRVDPAFGEVEQIADTGGFVLGLCLDRAGAIYVCDAGRAEVVRVDPGTGHVETWCDGAGGSALVCPNWPAFAADGTLYLSDSGPEEPGVAAGRLVKILPGGEPVALDLPPLHFPNGLAVCRDGSLVVLESFRPRLSALREGVLETIVELPGAVPDGVALTAEDEFIVSCYYPYHLYRVSGGRAELLLEDPTGTRFPMPTNVCFFGERLETLAIASLGGHSLSAVELGINGAPLFYPAAASSG